MSQFTKPESLNGQQLREELLAAGIAISDDINAITVDADLKLILDIAKADEKAAAKVVADHVGIFEIKNLTIDEKLASVGLSINDLKAALGI